MTAFGVSIFKDPEEFVSLYLGMNEQPAQFIAYMERALSRTKSPPIAVVYTCRFLADKTEEELGLDVIRFVSQLADLSGGVSMGSSLQGVLGQSSFLTELRHSLTHKTMVKGTVLVVARRVILKELQEKYWEVMLNKIRETYSINTNRVKENYRQIFGCDYEGDLSWLRKEYSMQDYLNCTNYEYKEHITELVDELFKGRILWEEFQAHYQAINMQKQVILLVISIEKYLVATNIPSSVQKGMYSLVKNLSPKLLENQLIQRSIHKIYFLSYLSHPKKLYQAVPEQTRSEIENWWIERQKQTGHTLYLGQTVEQ